jgi:hypothetical protein
VTRANKISLFDNVHINKVLCQLLLGKKEHGMSFNFCVMLYKTMKKYILKMVDGSVNGSMVNASLASSNPTEPWRTQLTDAFSSCLEYTQSKMAFI